MSHTVSGKITRAPKVQPGTNSNGQYTAFFFEISEFIKGYGEEADSYTNYSVAFFPKSQGAIDFHTKAIQEGAFVVVSCEKLKIDISNVDYPKLKMDNARLENFFNPSQQSSAPTQQSATSQPTQQAGPAYQPAPQKAPKQQVPLSETDQGWVNAVKANPALIDQIEDPAYKAKIKSLT